jgi:hypothetical protein
MNKWKTAWTPTPLAEIFLNYGHIACDVLEVFGGISKNKKQKNNQKKKTNKQTNKQKPKFMLLNFLFFQYVLNRRCIDCIISSSDTFRLTFFKLVHIGDVHVTLEFLGLFPELYI